MIASNESMRFDYLPGGLWEGIVARLGPTDLSSLAACNQELRQLASSDFIWTQIYKRDWGVDGEAHAAQAAASVLGSPPRPLSAARPSAALLEAAATDNKVAGGLSTPTGRPTAWKLLYRAKKETEANWQAGRFSETRLQGHDDFIRCLELFQLPGGRRRLVSASGSYAEKDCSIRVWELGCGGQGRCVERLVGHDGPIWSMQSGGGRQGPGGDSMIASVGDDGTLRVWDLDTHRVGVSRRLGPERLMSLSWDVEGGRLAACNDEGGIAIWSLEQIQHVLQEPSEEGSASPGPEEQADGEFPSWQEVSLDCAECTPAVTMSPPRPAGPSSPTACIQLDGELLITGEGCSGGRVLLWDVPVADPDDQVAPVPRVSATLGLHGRGVSCLAFQRASGALAVGSVQGGLRLWDVASCEASVNLWGHKRDVLCMQLGASAPGPLLLATGSADRTVRVWDTRAGECAHTLSLASMPYCLQLGGSGDGRLAVGCSDGSVHLWDLRAGSSSSGASTPPPLVLSGHADRVWALAMDESSLVSAGLDGDILVRSFLPSPQ